MWSAKIQGLRYAGSVAANAVLASIVRAGGDPILISPVGEFDSWDIIDGMVLPGGADIDPARYGAVADEHDWRTDFDGQDDADAATIAKAEELGIPTLLICRGMQLWNVERGGTMVQHLPDEPQNHVGTIHDVTIEAGTRLSAAVGGKTRIDTSSYHHQGLGEIGRGLNVIARADDGTVEAVEDPSLNIIAVQWHPEDRAADGGTDAALFDWVVAQARERVAANG
ncbi:gamma-glutamyl-gamma-aminobutyrate hydrolase family protein [Gulosibacter macacae]|uniref:Gamma-glutamyl-gamma-aminobutyrate hydrolase family protein n=2 Tax=Gulosibacter macacae TaxID=2488791 RepID=A0A3P3VZY1_9MICO|nr:gamma-glutamyl-gamma-aminobutyrate hydrolase family protein [Gulosibacter macacae]